MIGNSTIGQGWKEPGGGDYQISTVTVAVMENLPSPSLLTLPGFWSVWLYGFILHFVEEM